MKMAVGAIRESPLRKVGRGLFSEESLMSVFTDITNHENGQGRFTNRPYGRLFSEESFMQPCGCTPWDENVCGAEAGNHKGCPYNGPAGAYFRTNDGVSVAKQ